MRRTRSRFSDSLAVTADGAHLHTALVGGELTLVLVSCMRSRYRVLYLINLYALSGEKDSETLDLEAKI